MNETGTIAVDDHLHDSSPGHPLRALVVAFGDDADRGSATRCAIHAGWQPHPCSTGKEALACAPHVRAGGLMVADQLPDMSARELLTRLREMGAIARDVLVVGDGTSFDADLAPRLRALAALRPEQVVADVLVAMRLGDPALESAPVEPVPELCGMVGTTAQMRELFGLIERFAPHVRTALIVGESGTGKEMVARALHQLGPRASDRFVSLDCTLLVNGTIGADVFGAESWQVAQQANWGILQHVSGGVLFLDSVGELPLGAQTRLLQALEMRGVHGAGPQAPDGPDVHVFAASDRDLRSEVAAGRFRRDLFYHLSVVELRLPPLRERRADIPALARAFARGCGAALGKSVTRLTPEAMDLLIDAPWDGNVRELRNVIERACLLAEHDRITRHDLLGGLSALAGETSLAHRTIWSSAPARSRLERSEVLKALERVGGNKKAAAQMLGLSRRAFYRRLERLELGVTIARRKASS